MDQHSSNRCCSRANYESNIEHMTNRLLRISKKKKDKWHYFSFFEYYTGSYEVSFPLHLSIFLIGLVTFYIVYLMQIYCARMWATGIQVHIWLLFLLSGIIYHNHKIINKYLLDDSVLRVITPDLIIAAPRTYFKVKVLLFVLHCSWKVRPDTCLYGIAACIE